MTDTTQPPAETLAACPFCGADAELEHGSDHHGAWFNLGCSRHWGSGLVDADDGCIGGRIFYTETETPEAEAIIAWNTRAALTRRAGDDAIPAGEASEALRSLERFVGDHSGNDDTTDGMEVDRRAQEALSTLRGILAATKPPAGGDAGAVQRAAGFMRHDGLCAAVGAYGYCDCGMEAAKAAALALPAPVVEGEVQKLREALRDLEAACDDLAANRSRETYHNMIHCDRATPYLEALDEARRNARAALSEGRSHG